MTDAGYVLREAREARGLSQRQLAARAHTVQSHISRIESGQCSPSVRTLRYLLGAMGLDLRLGASRRKPVVSSRPNQQETKP